MNFKHFLGEKKAKTEEGVMVDAAREGNGRLLSQTGECISVQNLLKCLEMSYWNYVS